jgi:hypothetical protein
LTRICNRITHEIDTHEVRPAEKPRRAFLRAFGCDPNSPFDPSDPSQWWRLQNLPHILVQPNPPPGTPSGNSAGDDGPDDWFVPEEDGFPNDWIYPDNNNAHAPAMAPSTAPPAPGPQPKPAVANRPPAPVDPLQGVLVADPPPNRAGAMAKALPVFLPDS